MLLDQLEAVTPHAIRWRLEGDLVGVLEALLTKLGQPITALEHLLRLEPGSAFALIAAAQTDLAKALVTGFKTVRRPLLLWVGLHGQIGVHDLRALNAERLGLGAWLWMQVLQHLTLEPFGIAVMFNTAEGLPDPAPGFGTVQRLLPPSLHDARRSCARNCRMSPPLNSRKSFSGPNAITTPWVC
ncbi:MAG: hypothetical protein HC933_10795 [Pleurocapsa sp. SU_196_0]|nr:hypothetical protein [Pleurocapsa sp. SU_196_0]